MLTIRRFQHRWSAIVGKTARTAPQIPRCCGSGSRGSRCLSLAYYVVGMKPTGGSIAAGRALELTMLHKDSVCERITVT